MVLNGKVYGGGLIRAVVLHGLLGSLRNWTAVAGDLAEELGAVLALDLRNHGDSGHDAVMNFGTMASDLVETLDTRGLDRVLLIGHSLGGKIAMRFAIDHPQRLAGLVIADIAPRPYPPHFETVIDLLRSLRLADYPTRQAVDAELEGAVPDWGFRQFLLTNLERRQDRGGFDWKPNLAAIHEHRDALAGNPLRPDEVYRGDTLFIRGGRSAFVRPTDLGSIQQHFPDAQVRTIENAGHNVHFETRETFVREIVDWHCKRLVQVPTASLNI